MKFNCKRLFKTFQKYFIAYLAIAITNQYALGKVTPPNYNFSLDTFSKFAPSTSKQKIEQNFKNGIIFEKKSKSIIIKYYIKHLRYKFPIFVQYSKGTVIDYWAKLPTYFLHDIFLQSLINRFGKQDKYYNKNSLSLYFWKNAKGNQILYSGGCTITCFPVYLYVRKSAQEKISGFKFLIDKFSDEAGKKF